MRINQYNLKIDDTNKIELVKEKSFNYPKEDGHGHSFDCPDKIADFLNDVWDIGSLAEEYVYMLAFDIKMKFIGIFELSHGASNCAYVSTKSVFERALLCGASNIVMVHNHPSKDAQPSKNDHDVYKRLKEASKLLEINVADFIIIGGKTWLSFCNAGYL